jgi:hypothetical protein
MGKSVHETLEIIKKENYGWDFIELNETKKGEPYTKNNTKKH